LNQICLLGNLTKDLKTNDTGKVAYGTLAVSSTEKDKDGKYISRFIPLRFLGEKTVESVTKYLTKGTKIGVTGELVVDNVKEQDGSYTTYAYVIVRTWEFAQRKGENAPAKKEEDLPEHSDGWATIPDGIDEELPFV